MIDTTETVGAETSIITSRAALDAPMFPAKSMTRTMSECVLPVSVPTDISRFASSDGVSSPVTVYAPITLPASMTCSTSPAFNVTFETSMLTFGAVSFVIASVEEAPLSVNAESPTATLARLVGLMVSMLKTVEVVVALSLPARSIAVTLIVLPAP